MDDVTGGGNAGGIRPPPTDRPRIDISQPTEPSAIPVAPLSSLLDANAECLRRIKLCYGADRQAFESELMPLVRGYASYVHLLPATPDGAFSEPGGLLRLGLETGLYSLQGTDSHILAGRATISVRRQLEPRWRLATFIAGMCAELHRAVSQVSVQSDQDRRWPAYLTPLATWLGEQQLAHYGVRWQETRREARSTGLLAIGMVLPRDVVAYLAQHNHSIVAQMLECVGGLRSHLERNVLDDLVQRALALVIDQELKDRASRGTAPPPAEHLQRYLLTALRRVAATRASWSPNAEKSRVWLGRDGLFLAWPAAADDLRQQLEFEQWQGIPRTADALLNAMLATGLAVARWSDQPLWQIQPPGAKGPVDALRLASALVLYPTDPQPLAIPDIDLVIPMATSTPAPTGGPVPTGASAPQTLPAVPAESPVRMAAGPPPTTTTQSAPTSTEQPLADANPVADKPATPPSQPTPPPRQPPPPATTEPRTRPALKAPIRLPSAIRNALGVIIESLDGGLLPAQCRVVDGGYFIPMRAFSQLGLQPPTVVRALDEARMLLRPADGSSLNVTGTLDGETLPGVILRDRHVVPQDDSVGSAANPAPTTVPTTPHVAASL
ncbi:TraI domain-containing protein [Comamonadaceae bacterium G21597-S1]|nr:TraI domain-containing protein [Comamonadaceae bacterium G21597-S1]